MRGSIRSFFGLIITMGAVGGLENTMNSQVMQLVSLCALAAVGLAIMASGVSAMREV
jgi:hypothetical protein